MLFWLLWVITYPFVKLFWPTRILGKKFLKNSKKHEYIFCTNHQSNMDAVFLKSQVNPKFNFMGKDSLFKNKFSSMIMRLFSVYPIKRGGNDISAVKKTLMLLKSGKQVVIFPEGTRLRDGETIELKNGLVMFAMKTDCYVIPAIFRKKPRFLCGNTLIIGKPFKFSEFDEFRDKKIDKDLLNRASDQLRSKMEYLKFVNIKEYKKELKNY